MCKRLFCFMFVCICSILCVCVFVCLLPFWSRGLGRHEKNSISRVRRFIEWLKALQWIAFCVEPKHWMLRLTFPGTKLRRQIFMTGRKSGRRIGRRIGRNFGRNFLGIFVLHVLCRTTHQNFFPNSSQFITVISLHVLSRLLWLKSQKCHLRELLGLGAPNECLALFQWKALSSLMSASFNTFASVSCVCQCMPVFVFLEHGNRDFAVVFLVGTTLSSHYHRDQNDYKKTCQT